MLEWPGTLPQTVRRLDFGRAITHDAGEAVKVSGVLVVWMLLMAKLTKAIAAFLTLLLLWAGWALIDRLPRFYLIRRRTQFFPELELIETSESEEVCKRACESMRLYGWTAVLAGIGGLVFLIGGPILAGVLRVDKDMVTGLLLVAILLPAPFVQFFWLRAKIAQAIRTDLNERGKPVCMNCGYSLRGMPEPACSECGEPHLPETCWTCVGRGTVSRFDYLLIGAAFLIAWGLLNAWAYRHWGSVSKLILLLAVTSPFAILGLNITARYFLGGRSEPCPKCGGSGVRKPSTREETPPASADTGPAPDRDLTHRHT